MEMFSSEEEIKNEVDIPLFEVHSLLAIINQIFPKLSGKIY